MTQDDVIASARRCIGTRFRHLGRAPGKALDCAGLAVAVAKDLGIDVDDRDAYGKAPASGLFEAMLDIQPGLVRVFRQPVAGDLMLMRFTGDPQHLAVCAGGTMIHAWHTARKVCEHDFSEEWAARVVRVYAFVGVEK